MSERLSRMPILRICLRERVLDLGLPVRFWDVHITGGNMSCAVAASRHNTVKRLLTWNLGAEASDWGFDWNEQRPFASWQIYMGWLVNSYMLEYSIAHFKFIGRRNWTTELHTVISNSCSIRQLSNSIFFTHQTWPLLPRPVVGVIDRRFIIYRKRNLPCQSG